MDRKYFRQLFEGVYKPKHPEISTNEYIRTTLSLPHANEDWQYIAIEEMAELTKEITKFLRDDPNQDRFGLIEEIADVEICLEALMQIYHISLHELGKAVEIKVERGIGRHSDIFANKKSGAYRFEDVGADSFKKIYENRYRVENVEEDK